MIKWNFPGSEGGPMKGVCDSGIENFSGNPLSALVREICQNSLDAALDDSNPKVIVEFERYFVQDDKIPGLVEYRNILQKCKSFWELGGEKPKKFLENALKYANKKEELVLRVSDYNTTGLSNPYPKHGEISDFKLDGWNALIKIDGAGNKDGDKGGSFGIGKSAAFVNSNYRVVFYRTLNQKNERAAQGVARLMSYKDGEIMTNGVGYYGNPDGNNPVESIAELDYLNSRSEKGTDVFIYGVEDCNDWESQIKFVLLENFLISIYNGQLRVKVQNFGINLKSLADCVEKIHKKYLGKAKSMYGYYLCLTKSEDVKIYSKDFHGMGTLNLRILVNANEKLDNKVLIVRKAGMKLFSLGNISKLVNFTGILELKGKEINNYFREMETVSHDNWVPKRHRNYKQAKAYYYEIKNWIKDIVAELAEYSSEDEMDVDGLSSILQHESANIKSNNLDKNSENLKDFTGNIEIIKRPKKTQSKGFFYGKGDEGNDKSTRVRGTLGPVGEPGIRLLKGKRKRKKRDSHRGLPNPNGKDIVLHKAKGGKSNCPLKNVRIIKKDIGVYSVNFEIPHNVKYGRVELVTVGENGKSNNIRIKDIRYMNGCKNIKISGDYIEFVNMKSSDRINITVQLSDSRDYAMEVNVYEHN